MGSGRQLTLTDYVLVLRRRWWLLVLSFVVCSSATVLYSRMLPDIYRVSTLVLVEAPKVPESFVQSTVTTRVQERLRTITQQIKSRTRVEQVARDLQLLDPGLEGRTLDNYLLKMINSIEVTVQGSGNDLFTVSYEGQDPQTVMRVANKLVALFIEANLKMREQYAEGTTVFLESELQRVRDLLQAQEQIITTYKQRHMGELPTQQDANQRTLDRLQTQLQSVSTTLESVRNRKSLLLRHMAQREAEAALGTVGILRPGDESTGLEQQLAQRRQALAALQRVYVDTYPDVIHLKQEVADLEAQVVAQHARTPTAARGQAVGTAPKSLYRQQQDEIEQIDLEENTLRQQQRHIQEQIAAYEHKVANASRREQELLVLTRDYESTQKNYDSLLGRRMQAQIAENLEKRQQSEQFKVLDTARLPTAPWKPNRLRLLLVGMGAGLAVGAGAIFATVFFDPTFRNPEDVERLTGLPVLATIPFLVTTAEQHTQRRKRRYVGVACLLLPPVSIIAVHFFWLRLDVLWAHTARLLKF